MHRQSARALAGALVAALLSPLAAAADEDPVVLAFGANNRASIGRDNRCAAAHKAADKLAEDFTNGPAAVEVVKAMDACIALPRTPNGWEEYTAYLMTADAAATLIVARITHQQRLYDRAKSYAEQVPGYSLAAGGHVMSTSMQRSGATGSKAPSPAEDQGSTANVRYTAKTSAAAQSGPGGLAKIASAIGVEATAGPQPQPSASP